MGGMGVCVSVCLCVYELYFEKKKQFLRTTINIFRQTFLLLLIND